MTGATIQADAPEAELLAFVARCVSDTDDVFARIPAGGLAPAHRLRDDLGVDSIGRVSLFYAILDALDTDADEERVAAVETIGDLVGLTRALLTERVEG